MSGGRGDPGTRSAGSIRLYLFDDHRARRWAPFTLTRPVGELLFGCLSLRERAERVFGVPCAGHLSRAALLGFDEPDAAPTVALGEVGDDTTRILLSSRAALSFQGITLPSSAATLHLDGRAVGWFLPSGVETPSEDILSDPSSAPPFEAMELEGTLLDHPWNLVQHNPERIRADIGHLWPDGSDPHGVIRIGDGLISIAEGAEIEPGVHVDVRRGPVRLAEGARVQGPARLEGPLYLGPRSTVLGGLVAASSIGPRCLVRGEVADSILLGFVNKAHDGHLGHAILGRWVNLGAFTTNSDLKNNYRSVRVWTPEGDVDTGMLKVGCFVGDHAKTGIGTVLNTGTVIGAGSNVYGGIMPPTVVPPFSWGAGADLRDHRLDDFLRTAEIVMSRRDQFMTPGVRGLLATAWDATAGRRAV